MSFDKRGISLGDGKATRDSGRALLIQLETGEEKWVPKSCIHDDSEVYEEGHEGDVVVATWWADKEGLS